MGNKVSVELFDAKASGIGTVKPTSQQAFQSKTM